MNEKESLLGAARIDHITDVENLRTNKKSLRIAWISLIVNILLSITVTCIALLSFSVSSKMQNISIELEQKSYFSYDPNCIAKIQEGMHFQFQDDKYRKEVLLKAFCTTETEMNYWLGCFKSIDSDYSISQVIPNMEYAQKAIPQHPAPDVIIALAKYYDIKLSLPDIEKDKILRSIIDSCNQLLNKKLKDYSVLLSEKHVKKKYTKTIFDGSSITEIEKYRSIIEDLSKMCENQLYNMYSQ
jgi:hypothetical protein